MMQITTKSTTQLVLDPVCGMRIDPATAAASTEHQGEIVYFCSNGCLGKFKLSPESYFKGTGAESPSCCGTTLDHGHKAAAPASAHPAAAGAVDIEYTCPMHPEIVKIGP